MHGAGCPRGDRGRPSALLAIALLACAGVNACTVPVRPPPSAAAEIVAWAIAARGGPLESMSREVEATVHQGFPGVWQWQIAFHVPDSYRWTLRTDEELHHYMFDGRTVRAFVGRTPVSVDPAPANGLRTHARWMAVVLLDVLRDGARTTCSALARERPPATAVRGLRVRYVDDPAATYELWFDARGQLIGADGPVVFSGFASGRLHATFTDFRAVGGYVFPFAGRYAFEGKPFFDERVISLVPNDPALDAESFAAPPADEPSWPSES